MHNLIPKLEKIKPLFQEDKSTLVFKSPIPLLEFSDSFIPAMSLINERVTEVLKPAAILSLHFSQKLQESMEKILPVMESMNDIMLPFYETGRKLIALHEKANELAVELEKEHLFLIPSFSGLADIPVLLDRMRTENLSMLEIYDEFFNNVECSQEVLKSWMENPFFLERKEIFQQCLKAHADKQYALSIPLFYIQIEKYCKHLLGLTGSITYDKWKTQLVDTYKTTEVNHNGILKLIQPDPALELITKEAFGFEKEYQKLIDPICPNRHNILHGHDIEYFQKPHASLMCILILDVLAQLEPIKTSSNN